jgi:hypothetical protein
MTQQELDQIGLLLNCKTTGKPGVCALSSHKKAGKTVGSTPTGKTKFDFGKGEMSNPMKGSVIRDFFLKRAGQGISGAQHNAKLTIAGEAVKHTGGQGSGAGLSGGKGLHEAAKAYLKSRQFKPVGRYKGGVVYGDKHGNFVEFSKLGERPQGSFSRRQTPILRQSALQVTEQVPVVQFS